MEPIFVIGSILPYLGYGQKPSATAKKKSATAKQLSATAKNYE